MLEMRAKLISLLRFHKNSPKLQQDLWLACTHVPSTDHTLNALQSIIWPGLDYLSFDMWIFFTVLMLVKGWSGWQIRREGHGACFWFNTNPEGNIFHPASWIAWFRQWNRANAKLSTWFPAGLSDRAELCTSPLSQSYTSFSILPRFQILPVVQNRCTSIRQTCDRSLWSAPANDNWCVIYTFNSVIRRCIRSCLRE